MRQILGKASNVKENPSQKCPKVRKVAAPFTGQLLLHRYYSSSGKYLLYESWVCLGPGLLLIFAFAHQRELRSNYKGKSFGNLARRPKFRSKRKI